MSRRIPSIITHKYFHSDMTEYDSLDSKPILFVRNLSKRYPFKKKAAINHISFDVFPGEFHAFIGANGAGKTTTIKSIIGAYANWNGTILINGIKNNKEEAKRKLGYIPENARFPEKFSALKYLQWMVMLSGLKMDQARKFAEDKLKELDMWNLRKKSPNSFSSGQKKKILLAQALIHDPDIIIMDEPVANLDPKARIEFFELLLKLRKKGKSIFISSHVLSELDRYSDSLTVLDGGEIVYSGNKDTLMKRFHHNHYICESDNNEEIIKYLHTYGIRQKFDKHENKITIYFKESEQINKFQKFIAEKNIQLIIFEKIKPTLDEIYDRLVIKGSVDTMKD